MLLTSVPCNFARSDALAKRFPFIGWRERAATKLNDRGTWPKALRLFVCEIMRNGAGDQRGGTLLRHLPHFRSSTRAASITGNKTIGITFPPHRLSERKGKSDPPESLRGSEIEEGKKKKYPRGKDQSVNASREYFTPHPKFGSLFCPIVFSSCDMRRWIIRLVGFRTCFYFFGASGRGR